MAKSKLVKTHEHEGKSYTCCLKKKLGTYPITIRGVKVVCLLAMVPTKGAGRPKLNPQNPRISNSGAGNDQNSIGKELKKANSSLLQKALERNEGQIEHLIIWKNTVIEGNRRQNIFQNLEYPEILVVILPDSTDLKLVHALERTIHISGKEEWESPVKSKLACDLYEELEDWKLVADELQFKNATGAKNYATAYIWHQMALKKYKVKQNRQWSWSKFHHAVNPTLKTYFGWNETEEIFDEPDNFKWFCQLIKNNKLTDCRQSDGVVRPIIGLGNEDSDDDTFIKFKKMLETKGAAETWRKWRLQKKDNKLHSQLSETVTEVKFINKAKTRWGKLQGNKLIQAKILEAIHVLEELSEKVADEIAVAA